MTELPFTVATLAQRWACSEGAVRARILKGELRTFRIGALIRIPASEVERIECPNTQSSASEVASPSSGAMKTASATALVSPRPIGSARRRRPDNDGAEATILRGQWGG